MSCKGQQLPPAGGEFNTLGLNGTTFHDPETGEAMVVLYGNGSKIGDKQSWRKRAKRKIITNALILALIDIATEKGAMDRVRSYWNTWKCQNEITLHEGNAHGKHCKNRFCLICTDIRKAHLINKYIPLVRDWERPCMTTLTIKSVPHDQLKDLIAEMLVRFRRIIDKHNKRHKRGKGRKLIGLRALECNFNATKRTYNPHFHILVPDPETGRTLMKEWRKSWNDDKIVSSAALDTRSILDKEKGMMEIVKYFSKIFSLPNPKKKSKKQDHYIYAAAIDNIIDAFKDHHTFDTFGIKLPQKMTSTEKRITVTRDYQRLTFDHKKGDWIYDDNGEVLTEYIVPQDLEEILIQRINTTSD